MRNSLRLAALIATVLTMAAFAHDRKEKSNMTINKITPLLYVERIEPSLGFWTNLGFERTTEVPDGEHLGFVILQKGDVEIMYQTRASVAADIPPLADTPFGGSLLFIEVSDLDAIEKALAGVVPVVPRRKTFYGADELIVREPAGNVVTFAQFAPQ